MSRALGAAFLSHQVEQLEKSVHNTGTNAANWRDRRAAQDARSNYYNKRTSPVSNVRIVKKPEDERVARREPENAKDADLVVVDASVLIHALGQVKKWCRDGRNEVIIVPLEGVYSCHIYIQPLDHIAALNTLDLLKKGTSILAQRARAASRILEAQVGTNPRIRVQRDDAFVLWDEIPFKDPATGEPMSASNAIGSPEWLRRTICCARWETVHAVDELSLRPTDTKTKPRVVLALLSQTPEGHPAIPAPNPISASPVPLPAPQPNKYEPRSTGALVSQWAMKAGIDVLEVLASPPPGTAPLPASGGKEILTSGGRRSVEEDRKRGPVHGQGGRGRRGAAMRDAPPRAATGLVERPPAVMAMMEMVSQPSRVVRVLARGEKLEPDS